MKIELSFAELHNPLFLAGTNLQMKLQPEKRQGLKLTYDRAEKELLVEWAGETAIVPSSNISSMTPKKVEPEREIRPASPTPGLGRASAQVSTPQSHVHAGPGHGDTGQEKPKAKAVL